MDTPTFDADTNPDIIDTPNDREIPSPDDPPWGSFAAVGVWLASVAFILVFGVVFLIPYLVSSGISPGDQARVAEFAKTDPVAVFLQLLGIVPAHLLTLALAWFVVTRNRKFSFRETLGWKWGGFTFFHAILVTIAFYLLSIVAIQIFGDVENDFDVMLKSSRYVVYLVAFFAVVTAPIVEEVVYRGLLYSAFQRSIGKILAIVLVTLLFSGVHGLQYSQAATPDWAVMSVLILLSLFLTLVRAQTGNLLPCIVLHTVFNAFQATLLIAEPFIRGLSDSAEPIPAMLLK